MAVHHLSCECRYCQPNRLLLRSMRGGSGGFGSSTIAASGDDGKIPEIAGRLVGMNTAEVKALHKKLAKRI